MADERSRFAFEPRLRGGAGSFQLESREGYKTPRVSGDRDSVDVGGHFQRSDYPEEPSQFGASLTYRRAF